MIWADFWSTVEPNLGILCVSLPMLGRLRARLTSRRGASKLEGPSSKGTGGYRHGSNTTGNVASNKQKGRSQNEEFGLESVYAASQSVHHESAVATGIEQPVVGPSRDGSEEELTQGPASPGQKRNVIVVQSQWRISRD